MKNRSSSQFWAYLLIGLGVVFLIVNILPSLSSLILPLIFIGAGAYILFGQNLLPKAEVKSDRFIAPLENATSARVDLDLSLGEAHVHALTDSANLIDADLTYLGEIDFAVTGDAEKQVKLRQASDSLVGWLDPSNWFGGSPSQKLRWEVGLNPDILLHLDIQTGLGESQLELDELKVTQLQIKGGAGTLHTKLPANTDSYTAQIRGGAGKLDIDIPGNVTLGTSIQCGMGAVDIKIEAGAAINAQIQGGAGAVTIDVPQDAAVRVEAQTGLGSIRMAPHLSQLSASQEAFVNQQGVWETPGFAEAERQINITFNGGLGSLTVQ